MNKASDLILRAAAIDALARYADSVDATKTLSSLLKKIVRDIPAIDAAPVVHARWVKMTGMMPPEYHGHYMCSNCEWHMKGLRNSWTREEELSYCPGCGAIMDGGESDESK